jgi:hypothetical protein
VGLECAEGGGGGEALLPGIGGGFGGGQEGVDELEDLPVAFDLVGEVEK